MSSALAVFISRGLDEPERTAGHGCLDLDERLALVQVVGGDQRRHLFERGHQGGPRYGGGLALTVDVRAGRHQRGQGRQRVWSVHPQGVQGPRGRVPAAVVADLVEVDLSELLLQLGLVGEPVEGELPVLDLRVPGNSMRSPPTSISRIRLVLLRASSSLRTRRVTEWIFCWASRSISQRTGPGPTPDGLLGTGSTRRRVSGGLVQRRTQREHPVLRVLFSLLRDEWVLLDGRGTEHGDREARQHLRRVGVGAGEEVATMTVRGRACPGARSRPRSSAAPRLLP